MIEEDKTLHFKAALSLLGNPEKNLQVVLITGTNGKGTVAHKIEAAFRKKYRIGLFTSPHIVTPEERIQISGKMVESDLLSSQLEYISSVCKDLDLSLFHHYTLIALRYFQAQKVDFAILEVGVGGLYDPTNCTDPMLSIITSVGLDHMDLLGATLDEIAFNKAGIIRPNRPVILGRSAMCAPILQTITEKKACLLTPAVSENIELENRAIAALAIELLSEQFPIDSEDMARGLAASAPARFSIHLPFIFDTAHNPQAFYHLVKRLEKEFASEKFDFIIGFSKGKDIKGCLEMILPLASHIYCANTSEKMVPSELLLSEVKALSHNTSSAVTDLPLLLAKQAKLGHKTVVCGSFYLLGPTFSALNLPLFLFLFLLGNL